VQAAEATSRKVVKDASQLPAISQGCRALLELAKPPDMARAFDNTLTQALLETQLGSLEASTGVSMLNRDRRGNVTSVALTGWLAVAGMAALIVLVVAGGVYGYRRYTGDTGSASTVVLKSRQAYRRVPSTGGQE
jgi:Golgi apparatus protein 1